MVTAFAAHALDSAQATTPSLEEALKPEIDAFVAHDKVAPPKPCQVLLVGSSSIVKWKDTLAADMAPMPVINRGFGSSHVEYINRWFDEIIAPYRRRAIVFYAGKNDIDAGKSVDRVVADFDAFMRRKQLALGETPVYFISVKPSKSRFAEFELQRRVNEAIQTRARSRSDLHYIDVVTPMLDHGKRRDIFEPDGLHMRGEGYATWTEVVRAAVLLNTEAEARICLRSQ